MIFILCIHNHDVIQQLELLKLLDMKVTTSTNTGSDPLTSSHICNWMERVHSRKATNADVRAGYNHSIACVMANAAYRTGLKVTFDEARQEVLAGGQPWKGF
mgnify:CR=1 FL=1